MNATHHEAKSFKRTVRFIFILIFALFVLTILSAFRQSSPQTIHTDEGERVFNLVCATCHKMDPPASMVSDSLLAPPMRMILRHYAMAFNTPDSLKNALTTWLTKPDVERSVLPAHAVEKFGLMPPLTISETERTAVITYLMTLLPSDEHEGMNGMMNHDMKEMEGAKKQGN